MGRRIMIVDKSPTMRRILRGVVHANLNDAEVVENNGVADSIVSLEQGSFHIILYAWDAFSMDWVELYEKAKEKQGSGGACHMILLVSSLTIKSLEKAIEVGFPKELVIPATAEEIIIATINRVCSPISLRSQKRFCVPNTTATFEQRQYLFAGNVVNISSGGMLCDMDYSEDFRFDRQSMVSLIFKDKEYKLKGFLSVTSRVYVIESNPDFSPKRLRLGIRFLTVSPENEAILAKIFEKAKVEDRRD